MGERGKGKDKIRLERELGKEGRREKGGGEEGRRGGGEGTYRFVPHSSLCSQASSFPNPIPQIRSLGLASINFLSPFPVSSKVFKARPPSESESERELWPNFK